MAEWRRTNRGLILLFTGANAVGRAAGFLILFLAQHGLATHDHVQIHVRESDYVHDDDACPSDVQ